MNINDLTLIIEIERIRKRLRGYRAIRVHLPVILAVGLKNGCRGKYLCKALSIKYEHVGQRFSACQKAGVVRKASGRYYLTDKGQEIYDSFNKELSAAITIYRRSLLAKLGN